MRPLCDIINMWNVLLARADDWKKMSEVLNNNILGQQMVHFPWAVWRVLIKCRLSFNFSKPTIEMHFFCSRFQPDVSQSYFPDRKVHMLFLAKAFCCVKTILWPESSLSLSINMSCLQTCYFFIAYCKYITNTPRNLIS